MSPSAPPNLAVTYSHPFVSGIAQGSEVIVIEHAKQVVQHFCEQFAQPIRACGRDLYEASLSWAPSSFSQGWDITVGRALGLVLRPDHANTSSVAHVAAALCLEQAWRGDCVGAWEARFPKATRLRCGRYVLPEANQIIVDSTSKGVSITAFTASSKLAIDLSRAEGSQVSGNVLTAPIVTRPLEPWIVLCRPAVAAMDFDADLSRQADLEQEGPGFSDCCSAAAALIGEVSDAYVSWVDGVIRYLVPLIPQSLETFESASRYLLPGVVCLTNRNSPLQIAETLIHEASHQYLYILQRYQPLHDPSDSHLYFSPIKQQARPIIYILMAYHAFANVALFFRSAAERGLKCIQSRHIYQQELLKQLDCLEAHLSGATSLTATGAALWQSLATELHTDFPRRAGKPTNPLTDANSA